MRIGNIASVVAVLFVLLPAGLAVAQQRCDCSQTASACTANVEYAAGRIEVTTDTRQCAQVLYYIDGQPNVALVTDGRAVKDQSLHGMERIQPGQCLLCAEMDISKQLQLQVNDQCDDSLLMPTAATQACESDCEAQPNDRDKKICRLNCRQHSRCLDEGCVASLKRKLDVCERGCDRSLQSSMETDIDAYSDCQAGCEKIKQQINSCPVL